MSDDTSIGYSLGCLGATILSIVAWITHVVYCISTANWILLLFGALIIPIGVVHGFMVWFGAGQ